MILIGMTGPIGHGKSTFAHAILDLEPSSRLLESSMIVGEVVNALHATTKTIPSRDDINSINQWLKPLPTILLEVVHTKCDFSQIMISEDDIALHPIEYEKLFLHLENLANNPHLLEETINHDNKEAYRPILQYIGGSMVKRIDPTIWYREIVRRVYRADDQGCKLCVVTGLRFPTDAQLIHEAGGKIIKVYRPGHLQFDMLDPTERERDNIPIDSTVVSDSDINGVKRAAQTVVNDLTNNNLQANYVVSKLPA